MTFGTASHKNRARAQVNKRALIESDGLTLRAAHALHLFKNEGLAPDAPERVAAFLKKRKRRG